MFSLVWLRPWLVLVSVLVLVGFGCGGGGGSGRERGGSTAAVGGGGLAATTAGEEWAGRLIDRESGVAVEYPAGWDATTEPLTEVVWPPLRLAIASYPLGQSEPDANCSPTTALNALPVDGALMLILEYTEEPAGAGTLAEFRARPERFRLDEESFQAYECFGLSYMLRFADGGRRFQAHVVFGEETDETTRSTVLAILDGLQVEAASGGRLLARNDVSIAVPAGWDGRILFRDPARSRGVIFQVANFQLPTSDGFDPPGELPPGEQDAIKAMGAGDVLVTVIADAPWGEPLPETLTLDRLRFLAKGAPRVQLGHTVAEGSFCSGERCVRVEVDFGGQRESALSSGVNDVLASLAVHPSTEAASNEPRQATAD